MRIKSLLRTLLGLEGTRVRDVQFDETGLVADVAPSWQRPRCSECGRKCAGYDRVRGRRWRHLDLTGMTLHFRYDTRRVDCPDYGVKVEKVPWAETSSWFTRPFEDHVGYVARRCDKTTVGAMMRVAWDTVGAIIQRVSRATATVISSTASRTFSWTRPIDNTTSTSPSSSSTAPAATSSGQSPASALGCLERPDRRPERQGTHADASLVRLSQRTRSHRPTHALLLRHSRHSPRSGPSLARIRTLNLVESPLNLVERLI